MALRVIVFIIINFLALGIGGMFTGKGVPSDWYQNLSKAPWTPPGWVFGAAWTFIMVCFAFYMSAAWQSSTNRTMLIGLFVVQFILNVSWNPVFFYYHQALTGLIVISLLTLLVGYFLFGMMPLLKLNVLWVLPYFLWLLIATSLNAYIYFKN